MPRPRPIQRIGHCRVCGYELQGVIADTRCSECGASTNIGASRVSRVLFWLQVPIQHLALVQCIVFAIIVTATVLISTAGLETKLWSLSSAGIWLAWCLIQYGARPMLTKGDSWTLNTDRASSFLEYGALIAFIGAPIFAWSAGHEWWFYG